MKKVTSEQEIRDCGVGEEVTDGGLYMNGPEELPKKRKDKRYLTLFIVMSMSLLLGIASFAVGNVYRVILISVIIFVQAVIVNNILEDYYDNL